MTFLLKLSIHNADPSPPQVELLPVHYFGFQTKPPQERYLRHFHPRAFLVDPSFEEALIDGEIDEDESIAMMVSGAMFPGLKAQRYPNAVY